MGQCSTSNQSGKSCPHKGGSRLSPLTPPASLFSSPSRPPAAALSREELKKEWEDFKRKQEQQRSESSTSIKGLYQCRVDATELIRRGRRCEGHGGGLGRGGGISIIIVPASSLPSPPRPSCLPFVTAPGPVVRSIVVTNSVNAAVGEGGDNMHLQGQAAVRNQV